MLTTDVAIELDAASSILWAGRSIRVDGSVALGASDAELSLTESSLGRALSVGSLLLREGSLLLKRGSPIGAFGSVFPGGIGGINRGASVLGSSTLGNTVAGP